MMSRWVVMFVDMAGSTQLKYREKLRTVAKLIEQLMTLIQDVSDGNRNIKFIGDGAMVIFEGKPDGCNKALRAAERIMSNYL